MIFACHISWALIPAPLLSPEGSRNGFLQEWAHINPGIAPSSCQAIPALQERLHIGTTPGKKKESHLDKGSFHRDICRGQSGTGAHDTPTLASESRFAGSAGMLSSTVLVSTATTPTGIPPSLQTGETHEIPTPLLQNERIFQFTSQHPGETNNGSNAVAFCRAEARGWRAPERSQSKIYSKNEHVPL